VAIANEEIAPDVAIHKEEKRKKKKDVMPEKMESLINKWKKSASDP
jgi:hypothetical protein